MIQSVISWKVTLMANFPPLNRHINAAVNKNRHLRFSSDADIVRLTNARIIRIIIIIIIII